MTGKERQPAAASRTASARPPARTLTTVGEPRRTSAQTREAILDAAERLFAAYGYRATSLEEIGREAGLSRGTPGYFFRSKELLYREMLDRIVQRARRALAPAYERAHEGGVPLRATVTELVTAHLELLAAEPALVRVLQWETLHADGHLMEILGSYAESLAELIREIDTRSTRTLGDTEATNLLVGAAALCWFPFAYAEALERLLDRDPRRVDVLVAHASEVVDFVLARLGERESAATG